jgi:two-component system, OmpR family, sensor histidine kinase TctE
LAREVALALLPLARDMGVDFGVDAPDSLVMAVGDRTQLREALMNLAHNALIHGQQANDDRDGLGPGTTDPIEPRPQQAVANVAAVPTLVPVVTIEVAAEPRDPEPGQPVTWSLGVVDNGLGLEPAMASRAGKRFAKGRGSRGAGLGLAMARAVAQRHGGTLDLAPGDDDVGMRARLQWGPA